ncbi:hypothetical protein [Winogradskyella psychrotolerans]|uniref:hypothetical protein n=1 Tax=Winogradskyella psychrotolerans TaxID=1344585 RepID=UPI001C07ED36|nr:hypothetical protein [Winogradskyella psychrotolerans]MBU2929998.1 hypothetical protein [Winogradskyella psychrotolerans]
MKTVYTFIAIIICIMIGFVIYKPFLSLLLSMVNNETIQLYSRSSAGQFNSHLIFALAIGFIPVLYLIIQRIKKLPLLTEGIYTLLFIVGFGMLFWGFRVLYISDTLASISNFDVSDGIKPNYSINKFHFEYYLFSGFLFGTLISILIFCLKKKTA